MATNVFFDHDYREEQNLYEDLIIEALQIYGQPTYYIPREVITTDEILNEEYSRFSDAYNIEMYIANTEGFDGDGTLLSKFGLEIRDQATFVVARRRFEQLIEIDSNAIEAERPREGDLIFLPLSNTMFQIKFVEHEQPFYRLKDLPTYELQCEIFEYTSEEINTGIESIDTFETTHATPTVIQITGGTTGFSEGDIVSQTWQEYVPATAELIAIVDPATYKVTGVDIVSSGFGYKQPPILTFPQDGSGDIAEGTAVIDSEGKVIDVIITDPGSGYVENKYITVEKSTADDIPLIKITGEVSKFVETTAADPALGIERVGDLYLVNVNSTNNLEDFIANDNPIINETSGDDNTGWTISKVYGLGDDEDKYIPEISDGFADNTQFEVEGDQIIDWSELNPFGDPRLES